MANKTITIEVDVIGSISDVWEKWNEPEHITKWAFASDDWYCPASENDLRVGGQMKTTMSAKDGSSSFDLIATYNDVTENKLIDYTMADGRTVHTEFSENGDTVHITQTFEMEDENPEDMQRSGWQAILNNFKSYVESTS